MAGPGRRLHTGLTAHLYSHTPPHTAESTTLFSAPAVASGALITHRSGRCGGGPRFQTRGGAVCKAATAAAAHVLRHRQRGSSPNNSMPSNARASLPNSACQLRSNTHRATFSSPRLALDAVVALIESTRTWTCSAAPSTLSSPRSTPSAPPLPTMHPHTPGPGSRPGYAPAAGSTRRGWRVASTLSIVAKQ